MDVFNDGRLSGFVIGSVGILLGIAVDLSSESIAYRIWSDVVKEDVFVDEHR